MYTDYIIISILHPEMKNSITLPQIFCHTILWNLLYNFSFIVAIARY